MTASEAKKLEQNIKFVDRSSTQKHDDATGAAPELSVSLNISPTWRNIRPKGRDMAALPC